MPFDSSSIILSDVCLGTGSHGAVFRGYDTSTGRMVAVKEIPVGDLSPEAEVEHEIDIMRRLRHPNLVEYLGTYNAVSEATGASVVRIVMEDVSGGTLASLVQGMGAPALRESVAAAYTRDIIEGLVYLHDACGVCHRDVKPENVLLTSDGRCKITDYGTSKSYRAAENAPSFSTSALLNTCVGTAPYMAPEVVRGDRYGPAADVWSLACLVVELLTGAPPRYVGGSNPMALMYVVASDDTATPTLDRNAQLQQPERWAAFSHDESVFGGDGGEFGQAESSFMLPTARFTPEARDFVLQCGLRDATLRPSAAQLLQHPWLREQQATAAPGGRGCDGRVAMPAPTVVAATGPLSPVDGDDGSPLAEPLLQHPSPQVYQHGGHPAPPRVGAQISQPLDPKDPASSASQEAGGGDPTATALATLRIAASILYAAASDPRGMDRAAVLAVARSASERQEEDRVMVVSASTSSEERVLPPTGIHPTVVRKGPSAVAELLAEAYVRGQHATAALPAGQDGEAVQPQVAQGASKEPSPPGAAGRPFVSDERVAALERELEQLRLRVAEAEEATFRGATTANRLSSSAVPLPPPSPELPRPEAAIKRVRLVWVTTSSEERGSLPEVPLEVVVDVEESPPTIRALNEAAQQAFFSSGGDQQGHLRRNPAMAGRYRPSSARADRRDRSATEPPSFAIGYCATEKGTLSRVFDTDAALHCHLRDQPTAVPPVVHVCPLSPANHICVPPGQQGEDQRRSSSGAMTPSYRRVQEDEDPNDFIQEDTGGGVQADGWGGAAEEEDSTELLPVIRIESGSHGVLPIPHAQQEEAKWQASSSDPSPSVAVARRIARPETAPGCRSSPVHRDPRPQSAVLYRPATSGTSPGEGMPGLAAYQQATTGRGVPSLSSVQQLSMKAAGLAIDADSIDSVFDELRGLDSVEDGMLAVNIVLAYLHDNHPTYGDDRRFVRMLPDRCRLEGDRPRSAAMRRRERILGLSKDRLTSNEFALMLLRIARS